VQNIVHTYVYLKRSQTFFYHKQDVNLQCFQKSTYYAGIKIASSASCRHTSLMNAKAQFAATLWSLINTPCIQLMSYVGKWFAVFVTFEVYVKYLKYSSITYFGFLRHTESTLYHWNIQYMYIHTHSFPISKGPALHLLQQVLWRVATRFVKRERNCPVHVTIQIFAHMSSILSIEKITLNLL